MKFTAILLVGASTALKLNNESANLAQAADNRYNQFFDDAHDSLIESKDEFVVDVHEYLEEHEEDIDQAKEHAHELVESLHDQIHQVAQEIHERVQEHFEEDADADELTQISDVKTKAAVKGVKHSAKQSALSNDDQEKVELAQEDIDQYVISTLEEQGITKEDIDEYEQDVRDSVQEAHDRVEDFLNDLGEDLA